MGKKLYKLILVNISFLDKTEKNKQIKMKYPTIMSHTGY